MSNTYEQERREALADLKKDGFPVTILIKGSGGTDEYDNDGNLIPASGDVEFPGYGITTAFSAYYVAQGIAKAGDCKLIFCPDEMTDDYIAMYESLSGDGSDKVFALVDGVEWRVKGGSEVKPTSVQVLARLHLTR